MNEGGAVTLNQNKMVFSSEESDTAQGTKSLKSKLQDALRVPHSPREGDVDDEDEEETLQILSVRD